ncbi:MAG TPA: hypothetical protein VHN79_01060, partial [Lacunisphaera sp.]|nr:hypothetical protein [Lacunisphaera sp.]
MPAAPVASGQPQVAASQPAGNKPVTEVAPAEAGKAPDRVSPINERWGQTQPSNDLIAAMMNHQDLALTKEEMEKMLTAYLEVIRERSY